MSHDPNRHSPRELPRLELPRFELASRASAPAMQPMHVPASAPRHAPAQVQHPPRFQQQPQHGYSPRPQHRPHVQAHSHAVPATHLAAVAVRPTPPSPVAQQAWQPTAPPQIAATQTRPAAIRYAPTYTPAEPDPTLLQRITPAHMAVMLVLATIMIIVTSSAPGGMKAPIPGSLPALSTGSSATLPMARSNVALVDAGAGVRPDAAAPGAGSTAKRVHAPYAIPRSAKTLRHGGIPSPAAVATVRMRGGGRAPAGSTGVIHFDGMPSAASAEKLGPSILPYKPTDGVTLPRATGERDSWAIDRHYGVTSSLPMERPVELPALTPGAAAARDEARASSSTSLPTYSTPAGAEPYAF